MLELQARGAATFDYGNNIRQVAKDEGVADAFAFPGFVPAYIRPLFCRGRRAVPLGRPVRRAGRHLSDRRQGEGAHARRFAPAPLARHGTRADTVSGAARPDLLARACGSRPAWAGVQRDGGPRRTEGARRHRPRPSRFRLGGQPEPRDGSDAGRLRRGLRLAVVERAARTRPAGPRGSVSTTAGAWAWASASTPGW